jgi:hypothetical protein
VLGRPLSQVAGPEIAIVRKESYIKLVRSYIALRNEIGPRDGYVGTGQKIGMVQRVRKGRFD